MAIVDNKVYSGVKNVVASSTRTAAIEILPRAWICFPAAPHALIPQTVGSRSRSGCACHLRELRFVSQQYLARCYCHHVESRPLNGKAQPLRYTRLFARRRYLLVLAGACGCVACLLDLELRLRRCCACGILPLIVIESEAKPSLPPRTHGQCQRQPPFARGHIAIKQKSVRTRARDETRRDETTVGFVAERDRVVLSGDGGDLMALSGYH